VLICRKGVDLQNSRYAAFLASGTQFLSHLAAEGDWFNRTATTCMFVHLPGWGFPVPSVGDGFGLRASFQRVPDPAWMAIRQKKLQWT
jgi:hypothetical protein